MLIGAIVLASLILLVLLAEKGSSQIWRSGRSEAHFYCGPCDLRYPREELGDRAALICPRGHLTQPVAGELPLGTLGIVTCLAFIGFALAMVFTGVVPTP
jgi:hypothetical protein